MNFGMDARQRESGGGNILEFWQGGVEDLPQCVVFLCMTELKGEKKTNKQTDIKTCLQSSKTNESVRAIR